MRVYILERPPVGTLYESILFVGLVTVLYGFWAHFRTEGTLWLAIAAGLGVFLHMTGFAHDRDGDNLMMLSAVLDTNFWLTTHVLVITAGYAFCLLTSVLAHIIIAKCAINGTTETDYKLFKPMHTLSLVALLFTAVGTVLGGIWADQSWGRFWGWDPKENGAMLIVLWLVWMLHGRISGKMSNYWATMGFAYLSVIVALSWFGVNLLSVGLHAYGFTDSAAWSLGIFVGFETMLLGGLYIVTKMRNLKAYVA